MEPLPADHVIDVDLGLKRGIALCLSGGGFRAMLFHAGALLRLNELGYLPRIDMISSVSGGSIIAGVLGFKWKKLDFSRDSNRASNLIDEVISPLRQIAESTVDIKSVLRGLLTLSYPSTKVADFYDREVFHGATLQDLPDEDLPGVPRFVFNATNLQTGSDWRFTRKYMADYKIGLVRNPKIRIAEVVCASGAFPPILSPFVMRLKPDDYESSGIARDPKSNRDGLLVDDAPLLESLRTRVLLGDGGIYDNLGLEPAFKNFDTLLVSDGGMQAKIDPSPGLISQLKRVIDLLDSQVRSRRKVELVAAFKLSAELALAALDENSVAAKRGRKGAYWRTSDDLDRYQLAGALVCPYTDTKLLAEIPTRLAAIDAMTQERLINFGYAACDVHMRLWVDSGLPPPRAFPYPASGVGIERLTNR
jgi:NTE family protein